VTLKRVSATIVVVEKQLILHNPPSPLYSGYQVFLGGRAAGAWR